MYAFLFDKRALTLLLAGVLVAAALLFAVGVLVGRLQAPERPTLPAAPTTVAGQPAVS